MVLHRITAGLSEVLRSDAHPKIFSRDTVMQNREAGKAHDTTTNESKAKKNNCPEMVNPTPVDKRT